MEQRSRKHKNTTAIHRNEVAQGEMYAAIMGSQAIAPSSSTMNRQPKRFVPETADSREVKTTGLSPKNLKRYLNDYAAANLAPERTGDDIGKPYYMPDYQYIVDGVLYADTITYRRDLFSEFVNVFGEMVLKSFARIYIYQNDVLVFTTRMQSYASAWKQTKPYPSGVPQSDELYDLRTYDLSNNSYDALDLFVMDYCDIRFPKLTENDLTALAPSQVAFPAYELAVSL